jgi:hypothetical protein
MKPGKPAEACRSLRSLRSLRSRRTRLHARSNNTQIKTPRHFATTTKRIISDLIFAFFTRNHALILHLCRAAVPTATSAARSTSPTLSLHRSLNAPGLAYIPADVASVCVGRSEGYPKASKASTPSNNNNPIQLSSS